jgi:hypothetical protein
MENQACTLVADLVEAI